MISPPARLSLLLSLLLLPSTHPALAQTTTQFNCTFPNGQVAENYEPCNPDQAETSCCLRGEACLSSGLCYGALGLVYRGGCSGGWFSAACPRYCVDSMFNLYFKWIGLCPADAVKASKAMLTS